MVFCGGSDNCEACHLNVPDCGWDFETGKCVQTLEPTTFLCPGQTTLPSVVDGGPTLKIIAGFITEPISVSTSNVASENDYEWAPIAVLVTGLVLACVILILLTGFVLVRKYWGIFGWTWWPTHCGEERPRERVRGRARRPADPQALNRRRNVDHILTPPQWYETPPPSLPPQPLEVIALSDLESGGLQNVRADVHEATNVQRRGSRPQQTTQSISQED